MLRNAAQPVQGQRTVGSHCSGAHGHLLWGFLSSIGYLRFIGFVGFYTRFVEIMGSYARFIGFMGPVGIIVVYRGSGFFGL